MSKHNVIEAHDHFAIVRPEGDSRIEFSWKQVESLSVRDFQSGLARFAAQCRALRPARVVIDATRLDPSGPALRWVSGQAKPDGAEDYMTWWLREIVPAYNESGVVSLAVVTGNPEAPNGAVEMPVPLEFTIGFFTDVSSALEWSGQ